MEFNLSLQKNVDYEQKISNIRARVDRAYLPEKNDSYTLSIAMGDIKFLLEEVERLRADISDTSAISKERAAVVAWLYRQHYDDTAERIERGEHRREGYPVNNKKFAEKVQEQLRRDDKADQFRSNMSRFATSLRKDSSAQNLMDEHQMDNIQRGEHRRGEEHGH